MATLPACSQSVTWGLHHESVAYLVGRVWQPVALLHAVRWPRDAFMLHACTHTGGWLWPHAWLPACALQAVEELKALVAASGRTEPQPRVSAKELAAMGKDMARTVSAARAHVPPCKRIRHLWCTTA